MGEIEVQAMAATGEMDLDSMEMRKGKILAWMWKRGKQPDHYAGRTNHREPSGRVT